MKQPFSVRFILSSVDPGSLPDESLAVSLPTGSLQRSGEQCRSRIHEGRATDGRTARLTQSVLLVRATRPRDNQSSR